MLRRIAIAVALALACVPASAQSNRTTINMSAVIASANTFQQLIPAGGKYTVTIQNNNTNGDNCWVYIGPTASATKGTSILLGQGGSFQRYQRDTPSDNIAVTCATTSDTIYADIQ